MIDRTPSPQSVEPKRVLDAAAAYLKQQYGASYGLDHPIDRERILSSISAAPAPSSLGGGEVETIFRIFKDNMSGPGFRGDEINAAHDEDIRTAARAILAALSPEAPAREGGDYTMALAEKQPFEQFPELALHIERMAMTGLVGSMISWDAFVRELNAALTQGQSPSIALRDAADELVNRFAWSAVTADCDEARKNLQRLIDNVRDALTPRETADHIGEANEKVTDHIGEADTMIDYAELAVAWRVKDFADGWIVCGSEQTAIDLAVAMSGATIQPLFGPALLSEIAALRGERTFLMEQKEGAEDAIFDALTRLTQAERQRDELRKALEPFAKAAGKLDGLWAEDDWRWNDSVRSNVTVRDIRRASQALTNQGADQ